ncbi:ABC transporter permease [Paroceanicella profunda]|uniref:ABC transporter permease n=1 Tax=Paroceanicella profunda TaxID=2579971 RepID=A0A5B8FI54_9RHOB|nr:ABC transporter permease [Paroceanicella profunda]QDL93331.1 ABC transporter permease [Paroceanicella profunda]
MSTLPDAPAPRPNRAYRLARNSWALPALAFLLLFFAAPLIRNTLTSFSGAEEGSGQYFDNYIRLFTDAFYAGVLLETLKVSVLVTLICLVIGYPVAYFMVRYAGRWNPFLVFCLIAPLLTSIIMRTFGWEVIFARKGLLNLFLMDAGLISRPLDLLRNPVSVYIGLAHVLAPFMVLSITAVLQGADRRLEEAARVLGAGPWRTFLNVTWPMSLEGVMTGSILVFVLTNGSFLTMLLLGGGTVKTLAMLIYQQFNLTQDVAFASAMGNVLLLIALIGLVLQSRVVSRRRAK